MAAKSVKNEGEEEVTEVKKRRWCYINLL